MRAWVVIGGAFLLAGCVGSKERVTLLDPSFSANAQNSRMGSLVIDPDGTAIVVEMADQQAHMCGDNCEPRVRNLGSRKERYTEIMSAMPREEVRASLLFGEGRSTLSQAQVDYLVDLTRRDLELGPRPGGQVIVQGFTDSVGAEADNSALSSRRASNVAAQLREAGLEIDDGDIVPMGEFPAQDANGDEAEDPSYRKVEIIIR